MAPATPAAPASGAARVGRDLGIYALDPKCHCSLRSGLRDDIESAGRTENDGKVSTPGSGPAFVICRGRVPNGGLRAEGSPCNGGRPFCLHSKVSQRLRFDFTRDDQEGFDDC